MGEYTVERILRARVAKGRGRAPKKVWEYHVKWAGYDSDSDNTWESVKSFSGGSEHFIESFWTRITSYKREEVEKYVVGTEVFPTGPPRKVAKKQKEPAKEPEPPQSEVVEDSESEVRSIIADGVPNTGRKRRASSPAAPVADVPSKRTRKKSARAAAASPPKKFRERPAPARTPSSSKSQSSAGSSKKKPPAKSRFKPVGNGSSVVSETTRDGASDLDNAFEMMRSAAELASPEESGQGNEQEDIVFSDHVPGPSTSHSPASHLPVQSSVTIAPRIAAPPLSHGLLYSAAQKFRNKRGSIIGLFSSAPPPNLFEGAATKTVAGPSRKDPPNTSPDVAERAPIAATEYVKKQAGSELHDEDAEGEIDEEHMPEVQMDADVEVPPEDAKKFSLRRSFSAALSNTIFGPLGIGRDAPSNGPSADSYYQRPICPVKLSYSVTLPLLLSDVHPPVNADLKPLGETIIGGVSQTPGKFYPSEYALSLASALRSAGSCAQGVVDENATSDDKAHFQRFKMKLIKGDLFVTTIGPHVLALCSSSNNAVGTKLGLKPELLGLEDTVVVSEVTIADDAAYCDAVMLADGEQW